MNAEHIRVTQIIAEANPQSTPDEIIADALKLSTTERRDVVVKNGENEIVRISYNSLLAKVTGENL